MMADTVQFQEWIDFHTTSGWPVSVTSYLREHADHVRLNSTIPADIPSGSSWESVVNYLKVIPILDRDSLKGASFPALFLRLLGEKVGTGFAAHFVDGLDKLTADFDDLTSRPHEPEALQVLGQRHETLLGQSRGPTDLANLLAKNIITLPRASEIFDGTAAQPEGPFPAPVAHVLMTTIVFEARVLRTALFDIFAREVLWIHGVSKAPFAQANEDTFPRWDRFGLYFDAVNRAVEYAADAMPPEYAVTLIKMVDRNGFKERVQG